MKLTLLDLVTDILNDMDADNVNSIMDTFESEQVAQIVKSTYYAMISTRDWPHLKKTIQLTPSSDPALPTHMWVPEDVTRMITLNYNNSKPSDSRKYYRPVTYREPTEFLQLVNRQDSTSSDVDIILDPSGVELMIRNDANPTYFTSFDDEVLVFNSYDSEVETTLQNSKTQAIAYVMPTWSMTDTFVPDLPAEAFMSLQEESKSRAMFKLKQMEDSKAEQESGRQRRWLSRNAWKVKGGIKTPDYGRGSRKMRKDPTFERNDY